MSANSPALGLNFSANSCFIFLSWELLLSTLITLSALLLTSSWRHLRRLLSNAWLQEYVQSSKEQCHFACLLTVVGEVRPVPTVVTFEEPFLSGFTTRALVTDEGAIGPWAWDTDGTTNGAWGWDTDGSAIDAWGKDTDGGAIGPWAWDTDGTTKGAWGWDTDGTAIDAWLTGGKREAKKKIYIFCIGQFPLAGVRSFK